jgi:hypothetical protein
VEEVLRSDEMRNIDTGILYLYCEAVTSFVDLVGRLTRPFDCLLAFLTIRFCRRGAGDVPLRR